MKVPTLWITALALCLAACSKQAPTESQLPATDQAAASAEEAPMTQTPVTEAGSDQGFIKHMHQHAEKLDDLMFALADGDLERAATPAYWLSQHETVDGIPEEWQHYVINMRNAAYEVETAGELETARAAAEQITVQCQECHAAAGVGVTDMLPGK